MSTADDRPTIDPPPGGLPPEVEGEIADKEALTPPLPPLETDPMAPMPTVPPGPESEVPPLGSVGGPPESPLDPRIAVEDEAPEG